MVILRKPQFAILRRLEPQVSSLSARMPRFVILRHESRDASQSSVHWDLMLESDPVLRTWALASLPSVDLPIAAEQLPDHRLHYLDYEGPISGNRGSVTRWDQGTFETQSETPTQLGLTLAGQHLNGRATLSRGVESATSWQFVFLPHAG